MGMARNFRVGTKAFNRTIEELKFYDWITEDIWTALLIEP